MHNVGKLQIINKLNFEFRHLRRRINHSFNHQIIQSIMQEEAIVAVDTSVDLNEIGVVWIITNKRKTFEVKYKLFSNK